MFRIGYEGANEVLEETLLDELLHAVEIALHDIRSRAYLTKK